ncbi:MAG: hypothetical protein DDT19_00586 [Syntrophomonadaceae bacterium]|nr:hypothetical protein [Bacillota bacterium]
MSIKILKPTAAFMDLLPAEYLELVADGPYASPKTINDLGSFKEIIEEHPHCAGCGVALGVRLVAASLPAPYINCGNCRLFLFWPCPSSSKLLLLCLWQSKRGGFRHKKNAENPLSRDT